MAYATVDDLLVHVEVQFLVDTTDDVGTGQADSTRIAGAITQASAEVEAALVTGGFTPPTTTTGLLTTLTALLTLKMLATRKRLLKAPEVLKSAWTRAEATLDRIAQGKLVPPGLVKGESGARRAGLAQDSGEVTDRDTLEDLL